VAHPKTNVVLLGRQSASIDNENVKKIIASVDPNNIPVEFIYEVFIITNEKDRYSVKKDLLKKGINYKKIDEYLHSLGIRSDVVTLEIVLDLAKVDNRLRQESTEILNKVFPED
jgi:hypothetical protein